MSLAGARVAIIQENAINESMGICDLAGFLGSKGVSTRLFLRREEPELGRELKTFRPDMVVVPCDLMGHNSALQSAREAKQAVDTTVVLGGTHPTFFHNIVLQPNVDYAFAGESEGVISDLLERRRDGADATDVANLIWNDGGTPRLNPIRPFTLDLNAMPMPDREVYFRYDFMASFPAKKFSTGRGCQYSCGYCFNQAYKSMLESKKTFFRRKSGERIAEEINAVRAKHPLKIVHFSDDLFASGEGWLHEFIETYKTRVGLPFSCNVFATSINDETIRYLKDGGCVSVAMGLELADDTLRRDIMNKPVTTDEIRHAASLVKKLGIRLVTFNILGVPWSSVDGDLDTLDLNQQLGTDHTRVTVLVPYPVSAVSRKLMKDGYLVEDYEDRIYEIPDIPTWPAMSVFKRTDPERTLRLYWLWPIMLKLKFSRRWMNRLVNSRLSWALAPISFVISLVNEKKIFGFTWLDGIRYFLHVKNPAFKTANYVTFI